MGVITQLNSAPYFDDYSPQKIDSTTGLPTVDKDFLRILFRPGYAVQARELNQLQAILQAQVERFGNHIFKEGSIVFGGLTTIDTQTAKYLTILDTYNGNPVNVLDALNATITGGTSGALGLVTVVASNNGTEPKTLIYKPLNGKSFQNGEVLILSGNSWGTISSSTFTGIDTLTHDSQGNSSTVSIDEGIFFTKGIFVINPKQTTYLDKYNNKSNKIAGLTSTVSIITEIDDGTLLDNASGSYNYAAPGSHRLKVDLVLSSQNSGYTSDKFINLLEVRNGQLYKQVSRPTYNELAKLLARRTYDESGDYTVRPFILHMENYPDNGATGAVVARISSGKAYVKGFEVETIATQSLDIPKARATESYVGGNLPITYDNYVIVTLTAGVPAVNSLAQVYLFDSSDNNIGTAYVRDIEYYDSTPSYKLALFDIKINVPGKYFSNVAKIGVTSVWSSSYSGRFTLVAPGTLYYPSSTPMIFDTGYSAVSSVGTPGFSYIENFNAVPVASGIATIQTAKSSERFEGPAGSSVTASIINQNYFITTNDSTNNSYNQITNFSVSLNNPGSSSVQTATINTNISISGTVSSNNIPITNHGLQSGTAVQFSGSLPTGLSAATTYYAIRVDANTIAIGNTGYADAIAGTKKTISGSYTGNIFIDPNIKLNIAAIVNNGNATPNTKTEKNNEIVEGYFAANATSSSNVILPSYASSVNNFYNNGTLKVTSGSNSSETLYTISSYNGVTKTATLNAAITVTTSDYFKISPAFSAGNSFTSSSRGIVYVKPTTLGGSINNSVTSITLSSGTITNASIIRVGSEEMYVTAGGGTTSLTVIRGYRGTTAASHSNGDAVNIIGIGLNKPDVTRVNKIISSTSDPIMADWFNPSKDVTSRWRLDNGQRDNYYDISSVILNPGNSPTPGPIVVFFDYLEHGINDGFFSVNSYTNRSVPYYYRTTNGTNIDLYNAIDCRATKLDPLTFATNKTPSANTNFSYNISYYLPRIDKIAVTTDGVFTDIIGVPSVTPKAPKDIDNALTLYSLYIPAYTYTANSITLKYVENKRYTMRDIGKLETRIDNLEYYTSFNALEQNTASFNVKDTDGLGRFKNGIVVDPFTGFNVADPSNPDFHASIDLAAQELRPEFRQKAYGLSLLPGLSSNYTKRGNLITKDFTEVTYISQPLASRSVNVNPFSVFNWIGTLTLTPNNDFWKDTTAVPPNVHNPHGELDNITSGTNPFGTLFNQWNNMWFGTQIIQVGTEDTFIPAQGLWVTNTSTNTTGSTTVAITQTNTTGLSSTTTTSVDSNSNTQALVQTWDPNAIPAQTISVPITQQVIVPVPPPIRLTTVQSGDIIRDVNLSEFIRPRTITFIAKGMKPNTQVYPFFDGKPVSSYVTPSTLTTNSSGTVNGTFHIPFGQFFVGDRNFLLTDSSTGNRSQESTSAEARYTAEGLETITTRLDIPVALPDPNSPFWQQTSTPPRPIDPLAESFFVDPIIYPEGIFISKIDLFFRTKDSDIPLTVQIRETVNGYPSSTTILTSTTVSASSVSISTDASIATTVYFPNVVYLAPGEYAIVLISNSNNYEAWVAQIGETEVGSTTLITEQPYVGSLFKSQNASTWTAEQTQDLTFVLYRCNFNTGTMTTTFTDWDDTAEDNVVSLTTYKPTIGSTGFNTNSAINNTLNTITIPFHPYTNGSAITYPGSTGITSGTYYTNRVDSDTIKLYYTQSDSVIGGATGLVPVIAETSPGTLATITGGGRVLYVPGVFYNSLFVGSDVSGTNIVGGSKVIASNIFDNTISISNDVTGNIPAGQNITIKRKLNGIGASDIIVVPAAFFNPFSSANVITSIKGSSDGISLDPNWVIIPTNKNYNWNSQRLISASGETFRSQLTSTVNSVYVSPVINATRQSVVQVENIVNNDSSGETSPVGGTAWARYITRKIPLLNDCSYIKVYLTANKPYGTDVQVYYQIRSSSDSDLLAVKPWIQMVQTTPSVATFSPDPTEFIEYTFLPSDGGDYTSILTGTRQVIYTAGGVTYNNFIEVKFKIVMLSSNTSFVPRVADFRAIMVQ